MLGKRTFSLTPARKAKNGTPAKDHQPNNGFANVFSAQDACCNPVGDTVEQSSQALRAHSQPSRADVICRRMHVAFRKATFSAFASKPVRAHSQPSVLKSSSSSRFPDNCSTESTRSPTSSLSVSDASTAAHMRPLGHRHQRQPKIPALSAAQRALITTKATQVVSRELPEGLRVLVLGGKAFENPETFALVKAVACKFADELAGKAVVLTYGLPGVQKAFAKDLGRAYPALCHLCLDGKASSALGVGVDVCCHTASAEQRSAMAARLADVVLVFEGGEAVVREAAAAFAQGAIILPLHCISSASSGAFNLPAAALECPRHVAKTDEWEFLLAQPCKIEAVATAVTSIIGRAARRGSRGSHQAPLGHACSRGSHQSPVGHACTRGI